MRVRRVINDSLSDAGHHGVLIQMLAITNWPYLVDMDYTGIHLWLGVVAGAASETAAGCKFVFLAAHEAHLVSEFRPFAAQASRRRIRSLLASTD